MRMKNSPAGRQGPDLIFRTEYKIFAVGGPSSAALVRRIVPSGQKPVQVRPLERSLPDDLLTHRTGGHRRIKSQVSPIRRPRHVENIAGYAEYFVRPAVVDPGEKQIAKNGIGQRFSIGRPRGGFRHQIADSAR